MSKSRDSRPAPSAWQAALAGNAADPLKRAEWLASLDHQLRLALPLQLAAHARLANVDGTRLVYAVDGPAWGSRLRLSGDAVLEAARSIGLAVDELVIRIVRVPLQSGVAARAPTPASTPGSERAALRTARELIARGPAGDHGEDTRSSRADRLRKRLPTRPDGAS